ncbi:aquaporin-3-like [Lampetra planeri]
MCSPRQLHAPTRLAARIKASNPIVREALAEFLGTFVLIVFGCGSVAQVELSHNSAGETLTINLAFAFGVVMGAYLSWGISGAHLNPAVSFSMSLIGRFHWWKLPIFCLAQFLGAFTAAATVYGLYHEALMAFNGGNLTVTGPGATAAIFATYPSEHLSIAGGFLDQVLGTALLLLCVMALLDPKNNAVPRGLEPLLVGLVVLVIGLSMGFNAGYAINPARDLGPRVFTAMVGYGSEVFTTGPHWWWVPVVAPLVGGPLGTMCYIFFVDLHHPAPPELSTGKAKPLVDSDSDHPKANYAVAVKMEQQA